MSTALANRGQQSPLASVVEHATDRLRAALPDFLPPARVAQLLQVIAFRNPDLAKCDSESVILAVIQAGSLGLDLDPASGEAWLIPRWNKDARCLECQFQPGYQGLAKLAYQTGQIAYIQPREVRQGDDFDVMYDPELKLTHRPNYNGRRGDITHVYCVAKLHSGELVCEVMTTEEIEAVRERSRAKHGPWFTDWMEMAKKTVLKRLVKRLPRSRQLVEAIEADNREYDHEPPAEHLAINHDNGTGHGSGAYAPPEVVREYQAWLKDCVASANAQWLDAWTGHDGVDGRVKELLSTWQMSGHLVKWGVVNGHLNAPDMPKQRQKDPFAAVLWRKCRDEMIAEAERYFRQEWKREASKLMPQAEDESQEDATETEDFPEPGSDG